MPRRAHCVFHLGLKKKPKYLDDDSFQCPEGLIVYFTSVQNGGGRGKCQRCFNAPKGSLCISPKYEKGAWVFQYPSFNAPKGSLCISPLRVRDKIISVRQFQCPEGLILYFTLGWSLPRLHPSPVSMPRRAHFVFHRSISI